MEGPEFLAFVRDVLNIDKSPLSKCREMFYNYYCIISLGQLPRTEYMTYETISITSAIILFCTEF